MSVEIKIPSVGESISEVVLAQWLKKDGEYVEKDDAVVELETDKINQEVVAPESGTLKITVAEGETLEIGAIIGSIEAGGSKTETSKVEPAKQDNEKSTPAPVKVEESNSEESDEERKLTTSVARKIADEHGVNLDQVAGSGSHGRVTKEDVLSFVENKKSTPQPAASASKPTAAPATSSGERAVTRERMSMLRKRIAQRLVEAQHTAAMLTTFNEVDMSAVMALRSKYKDDFIKRHGVKLGFMSFFIKSAIEALKEYPRVNAFIENEEVVYHHYYDVGVAVGTDRGLVVPVIRDAQQHGFAGLEKTLIDFGKRARENKLALDDLTGGTFTISNGGVYGSMMSTPILNPPQSGILGMHNIVNRPVAVGDQVVIRPMMYLALSYDHRIVDGKEAVGFLVKIKECIESPERMLFDL